MTQTALKKRKRKRIDVDRFLDQREGSSAWAMYDDNVRALREGRLLDVRPVTLELVISLACNLLCRECPYRLARQQAGLRRISRGEFAKPDGDSVMTFDMARKVLQRSAAAGVKGVVWTGGGEPTVCEQLPAMLRHSAQLGMVNGLYTNGIQLGIHGGPASAILQPDNDMAFVRVSLNFARPETGRRFSGATEQDIEAQYKGLATLYAVRDALRPTYQAQGKRCPAIQVSVVCDQCNVDDLPEISARVAAIASDRTCHDPQDHFVVRPLTKHCRQSYSTEDHTDAVIASILRACGSNGAGRRALQQAGIQVYLGFGLNRVGVGAVQRYADVQNCEYESRDRCWANGLFLSGGPNGNAHLCTDRNCDPSWAIGNLLTQTVDEIYHSPARRALLERVHSCRCGPAVCEATRRTPRLNRIARALMSGELTDAMVQEIRRRSAADRQLLLS